MHRHSIQRGFILLPVVLAIALIATIAFLLTMESAIDGAMTEDSAAAIEVEQVVRSGLAHATWGAQNSGCAGDMGMTTVPFGQGGADSYSATVTTPGGATTAYSNLAPDQDAWFRSDNPTNNNGTASTYHLRRESGILEYAVVRFDLSTLPAGAQINSAMAQFYVDGGKGHPKGPVTVHRATADWTETDATWESMGDNYDSAVMATIPAQPDAGDAWVSVNLTAQVQAWVNGGEPNYGIMLIPVGEGTHAEYISRDGAASEQPRLDVIVGTGAATPATISVTGTLTGNPSPANDITRTLTRTSVPAFQPATTWVIQPGLAGKDTYLLSGTKSDKNTGSGKQVWISGPGGSTHNGLFEFNLSGLPHGARVLSATLGLYSSSADAATAGVISLHRVTTGWLEGTGVQTGTSPADGATFDTYDGVNPWTTPGGDYDLQPIVTAPVPDISARWYEFDVSATVSDWVNGVHPNYGVLVRAVGGIVEKLHFVTGDDDTAVPDLYPKLTITYACECGSPCIAPQGKGNILMVVVNPTTLVPADAYKKELFESWGYTVSALSESANQSSYDSAVAAADVVYISESVNSTQVGTKLANAPIGVITEDGLYNDDLGISNNAGVTTGSAINVTDTSHYITGIFPAGPLEIYDADMEQLVIFNGPAPDLQTLAEVGGYSSLVVLEAGATLKGGATAAGPRAMLPLGRVANFNWDYLNHNGRLIVQRALQWGTGSTGGAPPKNLLLVIAGSTPSAQEQLRIDLIESWGYSVNVIDDNDSQANFDVAVAANDVAYVSSTVSNVALGTKLKAAPIGLVNEQGALVEDFGFGIQNVNYKSRIEIDVLDNTHYITTPFPTGLLTVLTSNQTLLIMTANTAPGFNALAQVFNTGSLWDDSLGVIDIGGDLYGGGTAAGRRVQLPWGDATFDVTSLNADGLSIMQRAIEWAEGGGSATTGPLAHWKLDETTGLTAVDSVGGHDGTLTNDPTWGMGQVGGSLGFDGSNDYIDVPYDAALSLTQGMTFTSWIKATSFGSGYQAIISTDIPGNGASNYWFGTWQGEVVFGFWADSAFRTVQSTGLNLQPDTWYHLAASFDNATDQVLLYLDGAQVQAGSITFEPTPETANILIGRSIDGEYWPGKLDEVRIYDQVLDAAEIADLAAESNNTELNVLLAVGDATTLASKDAGRKTLMESWGYTINVIDDGESQAAFDTAVAANDVVFVTSSVGGGTLADKLTGAAIPIVNEFPGKLDNFGFSSVTTDTFSADSFSKSDGSHYISSPYGGGSISLLTSFMTMPKPSGTLAPDLQVVAELATSEFGLVALDAGGTRWDGNPAAARRVFLPYGDALTSQITTEGQDLMKRSIEWALGGGGGGGGGGSPPGNVVYEGFAEVNPSTTYNVDVPTPAGTVAGDLLIAAIASDEDASDLTAPAGWNTIAVVKNGTRVTLGVWWKIAGASEPATRQFTSSSYNMKYGWMMRFTGHDPANPINATSTFDTGSSRDPAVASATTTVDNTLVLRVGGFDHEDITVDDSGLTGHTTITMDLGGSGLGACAGGAGYTTLPTAGATGTSAFALTGREEYVTGTIAIAPAP